MHVNPPPLPMPASHRPAFRLRPCRSVCVSPLPNLAASATGDREEIRRDPIFRAQFHTMCANIGVDPLASNKGMWAQLLGFGDFYYELGVQVSLSGTELCCRSLHLEGLSTVILIVAWSAPVVGLLFCRL